MERLFGHERPASPPAELAMSSLASASESRTLSIGVGDDGVGAAEDEEAAMAADASAAVAAEGHAAAAAAAAAGAQAADSADAAADTLAGGETVQQLTAAGVADVEADGAQAWEEDDDLDESAVTGSAAMAQAPLVAVALGGTQGLAWPGSPGGGGVSPASMLLMGLPSPRGVAALMARTPQRAGLASAAAATAAAEAGRADEDEVLSDEHSE
jgi:hypothetical protein